MADLKTFSPIQSLIETWWKEERPEGNNSPAPLDLPIYRELLDFAQKQLKETRIVQSKAEDGETRNIAISPSGEFPVHDGPPTYSADQKQNTLNRGINDLKTLLPIDTPFVCGGVYDYVGRNGSNTYGAFGGRPDIVAYSLNVTSAGQISGSSKDKCGSARIEGKIDCETGAVEFVKSYSWYNLWTQWNYRGQLQRIDSRAVVLGRWERGRFAIWLDAKDTDQDRMAAQMLRVLDTRDAQSRLDACAL
ncbi:uncharacterized protein RCC_03228 [Ramularia collo-cygni]|uniref:Uncharacterized protein n=1 Tax=Ramularia collo-cygni TaxID=112498 RepID=A0A2D3V4I2_9PEZI|nr:uncharacterized protein RCC_03228 [Ramularia collo-cygni]CZT17394.1 uncharacterized protein RCC_03228 [Ramularia collo-cygni]